MKKENIILLILGLFVLFNKKNIVSNIKDIKENVSNFIFNDGYEKLKNKYSNQINKVLSKYKIDLTLNQVLTTIYKESGLQSLSKDNSEIIGDLSFKYKAYGIMQVRKPALIDVNNYFNTNFSENDLKDLEVNIFIGSGYLHLCKKQAQKENKTDYLSLMYKKYNAGIGTKKESENGKQYSIDSLSIYNNFLSLG